MSIIYEGIKAGKHLDPTDFFLTLDQLLAQGAETLILGCTELPLAFAEYGFPQPSIDPTDVLAKAVVKAAMQT